MNREEKEEEAENENESLSGSAATAHKSPGKWLKPFCFAFILSVLELDSPIIWQAFFCTGEKYEEVQILTSYLSALGY